MPYTAYQYLSDDGTTYQVVLPSDFADALSYVPAAGTEPYLPASFSPRYSTYQSVPGLLWASIVVPFPFGGLYPPANISDGVQSYLLKSSNGEQRGSLSNQQLVTVCGPQGPPGAQGPQGATGPQGPPGVSSYYQSLISADVSVPSTGSSILLAQFHPLPSGVYLANICLDLLNASGGGYMQLHCYAPFGSISGPAMSFGINAGARTGAAYSSIFTMDVSNYLDFAITSLFGSCTVKYDDSNGNVQTTGISLLKLA